LRLFEVGASAGLNLLWDRFGYRLGLARWGDSESPVQIESDWHGAPPPLAAPVRVVSRMACDRRPLDIGDPVERRRLLAYIWPGQMDRFVRLEAALKMGLEVGLRVEAADAAEWTRARVAPEAGAATVVYHSIFWQYLPDATKTALKAAIDEKAAQANAGARFAWLRMEPSAQDLSKIELRLTLWPKGEDRLLARVHPHGARARWLAFEPNAAA
jgi:hypothetical protein